MHEPALYCKNEFEEIQTPIQVCNVVDSDYNVLANTPPYILAHPWPM